MTQKTRQGALMAAVLMIAAAAGVRTASPGAGSRSGRQTPGGAATTQQGQAAPDRVARGKYLVTTSACHDCHTPWKMGDNGPEPDMSQMLSGHPAAMTLPPPPAVPAPYVGAISATNTGWAGPWGLSFTANLTPDPETGIGAWTEQQFVQSIRTGTRQGTGRPLLPPMPWEDFRNYSDEDLGAIFAYLRSVPAIRNRVPDPVPPTGGAAQAAPTPKPTPATPSQPVASDPVAYGKYLVTARGCGGCHTPVKMGARGPEYDTAPTFSGYPASLPLPPPVAASGPWLVAFGLEPNWSGPWGISFAANLTPDPETGIGQWTEQQFLDTLRNGRHQGRGRPLLPPMPWPMYGQMTDGDLKAIFAYFRTLPPIRNRVPDPVLAAAR